MCASWLFIVTEICANIIKYEINEAVTTAVILYQCGTTRAFRKGLSAAMKLIYNEDRILLL